VDGEEKTAWIPGKREILSGLLVTFISPGLELDCWGLSERTTQVGRKRAPLGRNISGVIKREK